MLNAVQVRNTLLYNIIVWDQNRFKVDSEHYYNIENITKGSAYFVDPNVTNKSLGNPQGAGFNT